MKFMDAISRSTTIAAAGLPMLLIQLLVFAVAVVDATDVVPDGGQCQPIVIEMCKDLPYNVTRFPNLVGDESQKDAEVALATFDPLIHVFCSAQLKFFLCSVYVPMCTDKVPIAIGPCRPVCESVRRRCEPTLKEFGFPWPVSMNCSKFPAENNHETMCMKGGGEGDGDPPSGSHDSLYENVPSATRAPVQCGGGKGTAIYMNRTGQCVRLCDSNATFNAEEKQFAGTVVFGLACVCCVLSVLCMALLARRCRSTRSDADSLRYPERALIYCTLSCTATAIVYLVTLTERETVSCVNYAGVSVLVSPGMQHVPCTVVGILLYYFGTTARMWWAILCFGWLVSSARNGDDLINKRCFTMHVLAWAFPLAMVIVVLMAQAVHGDELMGVCLVGAQSPTSLLIFVAGRELLLIVLSVVALLVGFVELRRRSEPSLSLSTFTGLVAGCYLPLGTVLFYCFFIQSGADGTLTSFSSSLMRLGCDLGLGLLAGTSCLGWILFNALSANKSQRPDKRAYMPSLQPPSQYSGTSRYSTQQHCFNAEL